MLSDHTKSVCDVKMTEEIQVIIVDQDHMVGLRRTRTIRETTQDMKSSEADCALKDKPWKKWFVAIFLMGLRFVTAMRNLTFCRLTSQRGERIIGIAISRGSIGCLRVYPLALKKWTTLPTVWGGVCRN